jgi:hypothetical protein
MSTPLPIVSPAIKGLNTEISSTVGLVDELWAVGLTNWVFDSQGKLSTRPGDTRTSANPSFGSADVERMFEFIHDDGTKKLIGATAGNLWSSTDNGVTWTDVTNTATVGTTIDWKFVNFNSKVIGVAPGHKPISWDGTGAGFADVAASDAGTVPVSNGEVIAAFGRLWIFEDATNTIVYTGLLDETQYASGGAGSLDTSNVWSQADSRPIAGAVLGSTMVIFSHQEILMYADGSGSEVGIDPTQMYAVDTIEGTGCIARDSVVSIGEGDLWFLSLEGIQSLKRVIQDKVNPLVAISRNVRSALQTLISTENDITYSVRALHVPEQYYVLFFFPDSNAIMMVDTRFELPDGSRRFIEWDGFTTLNTFMRRQGGTILYGCDSGYVGTQTGYRDQGSTVVTATITSPWLDGGAEPHNLLKALKEAYFITYGINTLTMTLRWGFDFRPLEWSQSFTSEYTSSGAEWGTGEFAEDEYGDGLRHRKDYVGLGGEGQFVKFYLSVESTDTDAKASLQELTLFVSPGTIV